MLVAATFDGGSDDLLGSTVAVHFRGVDQCHSEVEPESHGGATSEARPRRSPILQVPRPSAGTFAIRLP